jgi:hypothetical protein
MTAMIKPRRSVPHQRHQHARRGCCGREHEGYCESAQIRPVPAPVGALGGTRRAVMRSMRVGVEAGRQGHGLHFSRCATTHHTRGDVREPLSDLTGPDSVPPVGLPVLERSSSGRLHGRRPPGAGCRGLRRSGRPGRAPVHPATVARPRPLAPSRCLRACEGQPRFGWVALKLSSCCTRAHQSAKPSTSNKAGASGVSET